MTISEFIHKYVDQPLPRRWLTIICDFKQQPLLSLLSDFAVWIVAHPQFQTGRICRLFFQYHAYNSWPSIVNKGLTSWPYNSVEQITKLSFYKICNIFFMHSNIILDDFCYYYAQCTFVLKSTLNLLFSILKIPVRTRTLKSPHFLSNSFIY